MDPWYRVVRQTLAVAWHRRWLLVAAAWGVCLVGWIGVAFVPNQYEADARIYVDTDAVLTPLLQGLAINTATASQVQLLQKTLLSRPNLDKLIDMTQLGLSVTGPEQRQRLVMALGKSIEINSQAQNLFTISYRNTDPRLAHDVVAGLINIFMDRALRSNLSDMANAQKFLSNQIASYAQQLRAADQRRADFRRKYMDILPLDSNGGISRLDSARMAVSELKWKLVDTMARRSALEEEARTTPRTLSGGESTAGQLAAAEQKLEVLRTQDTDQNPDVIAARALVRSLKTALAKHPRASAAGGAKAVDNPVYEQLRLQLIENAATSSALKAQLKSAENDLARMAALARTTPQVEAKYQDLDRGYEVIRKEYDKLLARKQISLVTQAADTSADQVRLRVIDPPQIPKIPVAPNRLLLISLVLLAGIGAAGGLAVMLGQTDTAIWDVGALRELDTPVLGVVSVLPTGRQRRAIYPQAAGVAAAVLILIAVYGELASRIAIVHKVLL